MDEVKETFRKYFDATGENLPLEQLQGMDWKEAESLIQEAIEKKEPIKFEDDVIY